MQFAPRDFLTILSGMVGRMVASQSQLTDFNIGSVTRSLLEAPAAELEALYVEYVNGLLDAIPTAVYRGFEFERLPAVYASGLVTFTKTPGYAQSISIPKGTLVSVPATTQTYLTTEAASIAPDYEIALVRVVAAAPGQSGNTLAGSIRVLGTAIPGVASVTNSAAIINGRDQESDTERQARFSAMIESLSRGSRAALEYATSLARMLDSEGNILEQVSRIGIEEFAPGRVYLWVYGSGGPVSDDLLGRIKNRVNGYTDRNADVIPGYRAAGVQVIIRRMITLAIDLDITVYPKPGYLLDAAMASDLRVAAAEYLATVDPGTVVAISLLASQLLRVPGVLSVDVNQPDSNIEVPLDSVPVLGEMDIA